MHHKNPQERRSKKEKLNSAACMFLRYWGRDNMVTIFQTAFSDAFFLSENVWIFKSSREFVPKGPINNIPNIPALVQMMAWRWTGDKSLSKPMMP